MRSPSSRRLVKVLVRRASRLVAIAPLVLVLVLPVLARSSPVARIPALEPVGKEAGKRAAAAMVAVLHDGPSP